MRNIQIGETHNLDAVGIRGCRRKTIRRQSVEGQCTDENGFQLSHSNLPMLVSFNGLCAATDTRPTAVELISNRASVTTSTAKSVSATSGPASDRRKMNMAVIASLLRPYYRGAALSCRTTNRARHRAKTQSPNNRLAWQACPQG